MVYKCCGFFNFSHGRGAALEKRREDREKEIEADMRDRRREAEEIHEIKRRLKEEGSENLEEELARVRLFKVFILIVLYILIKMCARK